MHIGVNQVCIVIAESPSLGYYAVVFGNCQVLNIVQGAERLMVASTALKHNVAVR